MSKTAKVIPFDFNSNTIRVVSSDPLNPLFVANDVANALGYVNSKDALKKHTKGVAKHYPLATDGGKQQVRVIDEPNLYRLIFGSKLKSAVSFQDWVFETVLPAIRKTGKYEAPKLTKDQKGHIYQTVHRIARERGLPHPHTVWGELKAHFNYATYTDLTPEQYPMACRFLGVEPLEGEYIPREHKSIAPRPEPIRIERLRPCPNGQFLLAPQQLDEKGYTVDKLLSLMMSHSGREVIVNPEALELAQMEVRSMQHWMATYRQRLVQINQITERTHKNNLHESRFQSSISM